MNAKKILLIILAFTAFSLALRAQPLPEQLLQSRNRHCGIDNEESFWDQPVRVKPQKPRNANFLLPEKAIRYYYPDFENPAVELTYKYDAQQALETVLWKPLKTGYSAIRSEYNNTLTIAGLDMRDTVTYYSDVAMTKPTRRRYNNWKLYEVSAIDSFYYEEVELRWNETTNRWGNHHKSYTGFIDTVMWTMNRSASYNGDGADGWIPVFNVVDDPIFYNEQGFVTGSLRYVYSLDRTFKQIYTLDEDGSVRSDSIYLLQPEGDVLWYTTEYEWLEWHGFGDVQPFFEGNIGADGLYYMHPWMQLRNKQTLRTHYMYHYGEKLFTSQHKTYWNTGPHYSHIDSIFVNNGDYTYENRFLANIDEHRYNSYGNYNLYRYISFEKPDSTGYQALAGVSTDSYHHYYTDYGYGIGCDSIASWTVGLSTIVPQMIDSFLDAAEKVVRYAVVGTSEYPQQSHALRVAPNPASDRVLITASEAIQTLSIYDLAGKLVKTKNTPENDQIVFDVGILPKGIYVVRAQLKSGTLQMGKLVKN